MRKGEGGREREGGREGGRDKEKYGKRLYSFVGDVSAQHMRQTGQLSLTLIST